MVSLYILNQIARGEIVYSAEYCEFLLAHLRTWRRTVPQGGGFDLADHRAMLNAGGEL